MRLENLNENSKLYHGDSVGTTFLSPKWMMHDESRNQYGIGIYFTTNINYAKEFGEKICSINSEGLTLINAYSDVQDVIEERRAIAFMEYLNKNCEDFWYLIADYGMEVTGPEDVEFFHIEQTYQYMHNSEVRNWQIELCQYANNIDIFVSGWNKIIGIDGLYSEGKGIYCIIDTSIPVTPINFGINESILREKRSAEMERKFGRILFGEWQYYKGLVRKHEVDTEYESKVYDYVRKWVAGDHKDTKVQNKIIELSRMKDDYPTLLRPDSVNRYPVLYRALYGDGVRSWAGSQNGEYVGKIGKNYPAKLFKSKKIIDYKPKKICEGWTTTKEAAFSFIKNNVSYFDPRRLIIIEAKVPQDERLFKLKFTNKIHDESEVVRVSKNPIMARVYYIEKG